MFVSVEIRITYAALLIYYYLYSITISETTSRHPRDTWFKLFLEPDKNVEAQWTDAVTGKVAT
jgi:hypothetical protein